MSSHLLVLSTQINVAFHFLFGSCVFFPVSYYVLVSLHLKMHFKKTLTLQQGASTGRNHRLAVCPMSIICKLIYTYLIKHELLSEFNIILRQLFTHNMHSTMQSHTVCCCLVDQAVSTLHSMVATWAVSCSCVQTDCWYGVLVAHIERDRNNSA